MLGEGAFGSVYAATKRGSGDGKEEVAVKLIPKRFTSSSTFAREMNALLRIRHASDGAGHPNICGLREHFDGPRHYYLVLDLVSGGEMFDHLIKVGAYSEADAARLVREVASALDFLHGIGMVHGDLKPENLMLSTDRPADAVVRVVDFGCATVLDDDGVNDDAANRPLTPAYCPPEAFHRAPPRPSADMWAMGIILYVMLTGLHPYDLTGTATDEEIAAKIQRGERPPLRDSPITAHLSPSAVELVELLMEPDPEKRLTAHDMLRHPWVRGVSASKDVMAGSDKRLERARAFRTKLEADVFKDLVAFDGRGKGDPSFVKTSLIERSFRKYDRQAKGFVTPKDLRRGLSLGLNADPHAPNNANTNNNDDEEAALSLSSFSNLLSENMTNEYFRAGDVVYREDDIGNHMYFINSGTIELTTRDGFRSRRRRGDSFGEGALLHPRRMRSATVSCVTPVHAVRISRDYFEKYVSDDRDADDPTLLTLREKDRTRKRNRAKTILRIQQNVDSREFARDELLFVPGDRSDALFLNEKGVVRVEVDGHAVEDVGPGGVCGEHATLSGRPRNCRARCASDDGCVVHVMRGRDLRTLLAEAVSSSVRDSLGEISRRREVRKAVVRLIGDDFPAGDDREGLRRAFDAVDRRAKGRLDIDDLRNVMRLMGNDDDADARAVLRDLDLNGSGTVTFEEFLRIYGAKDADQAASL